MLKAILRGTNSPKGTGASQAHACAGRQHAPTLGSRLLLGELLCENFQLVLAGCESGSERTNGGLAEAAAMPRRRGRRLLLGSARARSGPRRDGDTRLIESRIVLELQSARGIRSAYGSIGT